MIFITCFFIPNINDNTNEMVIKKIYNEDYEFIMENKFPLKEIHLHIFTYHSNIVYTG